MDDTGLDRRNALKLIGGAATVGLAGCSSGGSEAEAPDELDFWFNIAGDPTEVVERVVEDYNEQTDGPTVNPVTQEETFSSTLSAINAGNAPHISMVFDTQTQSAIESGFFTPVGEILSDSLYDDLYDPVVDYFTIGGTRYSIPFNNSTGVLFYNADMFRTAGLDPEDPPTNFDEVREYSETLVSETSAERGITWPNVPWIVNQWSAIDQEYVFNNKNGQADPATDILLDTETSTRIYEWWNGMFEDELYLDAGIEGWVEAARAFIGQQVGMQITTTAATATVTAGAQEAGYEVRTANIPQPFDQFHGARISGSSLWVPEDAAQNDPTTDAIADFLTYLTSSEVQQRWHKETGYFPVNTNARDELEDEGWFEENPQFETGFQTLDESASDEYTGAHLYSNVDSVDSERMDMFVSLAQGSPVSGVLNDYDQTIGEILTR
jgi:sn-glycerol 3-phosphate transport system substrate-binding protein